MAIAIVVGRDEAEIKRFDWFINDWRRVFLEIDPTLDIRIWPNVGDLKEIDAAFVWRHAPGVLKNFPNLKCISSLAAGVDHVLADSNLPENVPIVRVMDDYMANDITQYVIESVLHYVKRMSDYEENQRKKIWTRKPPFTYADKTIGIMGMGFLGKKAAQALAQIGLKIIGWSHSPKKHIEFKCYAGKEEFNEFLSHTGILVCMLPLTPSTENILNKKTFSQLPKGAYLINLGRGEHLVEEDLLPAIASGQLSGACLDVQRQEPMPSDHPFWDSPAIRITPHIASITNPATAAPQIIENYRNSLSGKALTGVVDRKKGY